jgi:hypothetical protein
LDCARHRSCTTRAKVFGSLHSECIRVIGYDNERGKGDHRHYAGVEKPYAFTNMAQLVTDFSADVARYLAGDDDEINI